eukprot:TRINITY_DN5756_c0_g1_i2.p1 TRINITY_DN5756_c0_g1~~TRINITY_DN5756_c0_g1_i2.p1  ORF type:complete len:124 (-),score=34.60 TRINITY_DN5756_c0_g1_i2:26-397(-)
MPSLVGSEMCIRDRYKQQIQKKLNYNESNNQLNEKQYYSHQSNKYLQQQESGIQPKRLSRQDFELKLINNQKAQVESQKQFIKNQRIRAITLEKKLLEREQQQIDYLQEVQNQRYKKVVNRYQ